MPRFVLCADQKTRKSWTLEPSGTYPKSQISDKTLVFEEDGMVLLFPAYGRDYRSLREVNRAWKSNKDFVKAGSGEYTNRAELVQTGVAGGFVQIRYRKRRRLITFPVPEPVVRENDVKKSRLDGIPGAD